MVDCAIDFEQRFGKRRTLCHHDLNPHNILHRTSTPEFCFLDWEFAGAGIASMDVAGLAVEFEIEIKELSALTETSENELEYATSIYRYLCSLYRRIEALYNGCCTTDSTAYR